MVGTDTEGQSPPSVCFKPSISRNWPEGLCLIHLCPHQLLSGDKPGPQRCCPPAFSWGMGARTPAQSQDFISSKAFSLPSWLEQGESFWVPKLTVT